MSVVLGLLRLLPDLLIGLEDSNGFSIGILAAEIHCSKRTHLKSGGNQELACKHSFPEGQRGVLSFSNSRDNTWNICNGLNKYAADPRVAATAEMMQVAAGPERPEMDG